MGSAVLLDNESTNVSYDSVAEIENVFPATL